MQRDEIKKKDSKQIKNNKKNKRAIIEIRRKWRTTFNFGKDGMFF
jgi:hypothetical protein